MSTPPPSTNDELANYEKWNLWMYTGGASIKILADILISIPQLKSYDADINKYCHAAYKAMEIITNSLADGVGKLKENPPVQPTITMPSSHELPDWPSSPGDMYNMTPNWFTDFWNLSKPILEVTVERLADAHPDDPMVIAFGQLIESGDSVVSILSGASLN